MCVNWGCIPTKALLRNAEVIHLLSQGRAYGFSFDNLSVDYAAAHKRSRQVSGRQAKRVEILLKNSGVTVIAGTGALTGPHEIQIQPSGEKIGAQNIIIATGAKPRTVPGASFDGERIINFRQALNLTEVPKSAVIVGAGPIGLEFATIWKRYGADVTVVEMLPRVLPLEDEEIAREAEKQFKRAGLKVKTGARMESVTEADGHVDVTVSQGETRETISAERVLMAIGFAPAGDGLGLESLGRGIGPRGP